MYSSLTPIEAFRHFVETIPYSPAIRSDGVEWSYAALWNRVCDLTGAIDELDSTGSPVGLFLGLGLDYIVGAHAIWLSGRTVVVLKEDLTPSDLKATIRETDVSLVLHAGNIPFSISGDLRLRTLNVIPRNQDLSPTLSPPQSLRSIDRIPIVCSITPLIGMNGVFRKIENLTKSSLFLVTEECQSLVKIDDRLWISSPILELSRVVLPEVILHPDFLRPEDDLISFIELYPPDEHSSWPQDVGGLDLGSDGILELAMTIAEQISKLSNTSGPISTDVPLIQTNLNYDGMLKLHSWLRTSYDWVGDLDTLFVQDVTPISLARRVLGLIPPAFNRLRDVDDATLGPDRLPNTMGEPRTCNMLPPVNPGSLGGVGREYSDQDTTNTPESDIGSEGNKRGRRQPRRRLTIIVSPWWEKESPIAVSAPSPREIPLPPSPRPVFKSAKRTAYPDIGMAPFEVWSGKKAGMIAGLLALGAMVGSPTFPTTRSFINSPSRTTTFSLNSPAGLFDVRSPGSITPAQHSSILSPWLDVVHFHGHEPVQSPWVADYPRSGGKGSTDLHRFPLSPSGYSSTSP